jgi:hypothetical protein
MPCHGARLCGTVGRCCAKWHDDPQDVANTPWPAKFPNSVGVPENIAVVQMAKSSRNRWPAAWEYDIMTNQLARESRYVCARAGPGRQARPWHRITLMCLQPVDVVFSIILRSPVCPCCLLQEGRHPPLPKTGKFDVVLSLALSLFFQ